MLDVLILASDQQVTLGMEDTPSLRKFPMMGEAAGDTFRTCHARKNYTDAKGAGPCFRTRLCAKNRRSSRKMDQTPTLQFSWS
jgi:hypothetical protein